jgi:hypothetical protein
MVNAQGSHESHNNSNEDDGPTFDDDNVDEQRDQIAQAMWDDYQEVRRKRRNTHTDGSTESDSNDDLDDELDSVL